LASIDLPTRCPGTSAAGSTAAGDYTTGAPVQAALGERSSAW